MEVFITEFIKYGLFFHIFLNKRFQHLKIGVPIFLCISGILFPMTFAEKLPWIIVLFCGVIVWFFCIQDSAKNRIKTILIAIFFISCIDEPLLYIVRCILMVKGYHFQFHNIYFMDNIVILCFFICYYFIRKQVSTKNYMASKLFMIIVYLFVPIIMISLFVTISGVEFLVGHFYDDLKLYIFFSIFAGIAYIGLGCIGGTILYILYLNKQKDNLLEAEIKLKDAQKSYYEIMLAKEEETKRFRHDMANHLICLQEIMEKEKLDIAKEYISHMQQNFLQIRSRNYQTGNIILDSMLNYYLPMLNTIDDKETIDIMVIGSLHETVTISDLEFCTIISNLIQNAVEELIRLKSGKRMFQLYVKSGKSYVEIEIVNSTDKEYQQNLPKTIKEDKNNHGMGLWNVQKEVEKWNGIFEWNCEKGIFKTKLVLPLNINKERGMNKEK